MKYSLTKIALTAIIALGVVSCSSDDDSGNDGGTPPPSGSEEIYALGLGVTTSTATTNYVVQTDNLMEGSISVVGNGILQEGYRDFASGGGTFYSIGGLGVTDVNAYTLNEDEMLEEETGLTFELANNDFMDPTGAGTTMLGVSLPVSPSEGLNAQFYTVDIASNTVTNEAEVAMDAIHPSEQDWFFHTGMQVSGNRLYQTFYPVDYTTYATENTDTNYVAVYSYPDFELETIMKDTRTGPSGAFGTRSGIFSTENGDLYTVSTSSYSNGYSQSTKPAGILKINAGTTTFDEEYFFNTDEAANGGKVAHAIYVGEGKLFAAVTVVEPTANDRWSDANLQLSIVDLYNETITPVANTPLFTGNGGRSFAAMENDGKVYYALTDKDNITNIYEIDIASASATKGAEIEATFVGGIAKMK